MTGGWPAIVLAPLLAACAGAGAPPAPSSYGLSVEMDSVSLLAPRRLAELRPERRVEWDRYLSRSRALRARDRDSLEAERRATGGLARVPAPAGRDFSIADSMTKQWLRSDAGRRLRATLRSYQTPSGGWAKAVDFTKGPRRTGQSFSSQATDWHFTPTIDNDATTDEVMLLALAVMADGDERDSAAVERGADYLLDAQMPNGCWPQVYPLEGGYHDAVTLNDGAMLRAMRVLESIARQDTDRRFRRWPSSAPQRARAARALPRAIECLLDAQVVVNGRRTIWGQQHDPLTLAPTSGRSYELTALAPDESADILLHLMEIDRPADEVVRAVHMAADWYLANDITGRRYERWTLTEDPTAGPLWGRMVEIGTNRAIFSNRDGVTLYDVGRLTDRATGYRWFTAKPRIVLDRYQTWSVAHPRP